MKDWSDLHTHRLMLVRAILERKRGSGSPGRSPSYQPECRR